MSLPMVLRNGPDSGAFRARAPAQPGYIAGPIFDQVWIIWMPTICLLVGGGISFFSVEEERFPMFGRPLRVTETLAVAVMFAHLFSTIFRSHLNGYFLRSRLSRTTIGPIVVACVLAWWEDAWLVFPILVVAFDIWHSALQTFGFGRIYEARCGNDVTWGRWWDKGLAVLVYAGPIVGGLNVFWYLAPLRLADPFTGSGGSRLLEGIVWRGSEIATGLTIIGAVYLALYVAAHVHRARRGYRVSWNKIMLYGSLTSTTVLAFGFNTFDQAYLITESFHAVQYLAFLGWSEQTNLARRVGLEASRYGRFVSWALILGVSFGAGLWVAAHWQTRVGAICILVVGAAHYWCDGFIWSVRRGDV